MMLPTCLLEVVRAVRQHDLCPFVCVCTGGAPACSKDVPMHQARSCTWEHVVLHTVTKCQTIARSLTALRALKLRPHGTALMGVAVKNSRKNDNFSVTLFGCNCQAQRRMSEQDVQYCSHKQNGAQNVLVRLAEWCASTAHVPRRPPASSIHHRRVSMPPVPRFDNATYTCKTKLGMPSQTPLTTNSTPSSFAL
eukprot:4377707-Amphidinium_carterae.1